MNYPVRIEKKMVTIVLIFDLLMRALGDCGVRHSSLCLLV
jgi:hypothetical protein